MYEKFRRNRRVKKAMQPVNVPELVTGCKACGKKIYLDDLKRTGYCCPECGSLFTVPVRERIGMLVDGGRFEETEAGLRSTNAAGWEGYDEKLEAARSASGENEAVVTGRAEIAGRPVAVGVMDQRFMMGSMGAVVGEKIARLAELARAEKRILILVITSGGARMQEGIISLMQMAKTAQAIECYQKAGGLYIAVLTHPTFGGVSASFATLADYIIAEEGALIGFAGPRVIAQTIREKLPKGFQTAEFVRDTGFADLVATRKELRETLARLIRLHPPEKERRDMVMTGPAADTGTEGLFLTEKEIRRKADRPEPYERVREVRQAEHRKSGDYLFRLFDGFLELHGDRVSGDDRAIIGGIAMSDGRPVTVIAQQKGRNLKENRLRNFGMPTPAGYRKAMRLMRQAERFGRPVFCLVDTPGAYCGIEAERQGQSMAIAECIRTLISLNVPTLSFIVGEGGSGGALAMACTDEIWMPEDAVFSVISPEGCAGILYKDAARAEEAARRLGLTAEALYDAGVADRVTGCNPDMGLLRAAVMKFYEEAASETQESRMHRRMAKYRCSGDGYYVDDGYME